jgi:hypothetical protein
VEGIDKVQGVAFKEIFDAKIVDAEGKRGGLGFVAPETRGEGGWLVTEWGKFVNKLFECDDACFLEAVHASADFEVDETVGVDVWSITWVVPYFLGDHFGEYTDVLEVLHRGIKIEVYDVDKEITSTFVCIGDGAVDVQLGVEHGYCGRTGVARVVELVSSSRHGDTMCLCFLWPNVANVVGIRDMAVWRDIIFVDKEDGAGAGDSFRGRAGEADAEFQEPAPFIGAGA